MADNQHFSETFKGLINIALEGMKILALVNGGAAVALLTFSGNVVTKLQPGLKLGDIRWAGLWFCGGLFLAVIMFILAYWTQLRLLHETRCAIEGTIAKSFHVVGIWAGLILALLSASCFAIGCWVSGSALSGVTG